MAQLMPLPLTVSCFSKIQIGFAFLVPAHPGSPGQRAVKQVCVCMVYGNAAIRCYTHTHPFKTNLDFTEARDSEWQWHQLGICKSAPRSRQITTPALHHSVFYRLDALPVAQRTASKH